MRTSGKIGLLGVALLASLALASAHERAAFADVFFDPPGDAAAPEAGPPVADAAADAGLGLTVEAYAVSPSDAGVDATTPEPTVDTPMTDDAGAAAASDASTEYTGVSVALRGGYAFPGGQAKSVPLGDVVKFVAPIGLDVGYYLRPNLYVGAYFLYGFAGTSKSSADACPSGTDTSCNAQSYKAGIVAEYAFRHTRTWSPWVRGGIGMDVINLTATDNTGATVQSSALSGLEWAVLSGGVDWKPGYFYGIGPFAELALGDYGYKGGLADPHLFFALGLRARTGLFIP